MDPEDSLQDLVRCHACENNIAPLHCDFCHKNLCPNCTVDHLKDETMQHIIVLFKRRKLPPIYPMCQKHGDKQLEFHCEPCDISLCSVCASQTDHKEHTLISRQEYLELCLQRDIQELEQTIYPAFKKIEFNLSLKKTDCFSKMKTALNRQGDEWHREIDKVIKKLESDISKMKHTHDVALRKQRDEIKIKIGNISSWIENIKKVLDSKDARFITMYKSKNAELRKLPHVFTAYLPQFLPKLINTDTILEHFSELSPMKILLDDPKVITTLKTTYGGYLKEFRNIACQSDQNIWTCGENKIINLYNLHGEIIRSFETWSGNCPKDISIGKEEGYLLYTDYSRCSINIVKNTGVEEEVIRLKGWKPRGLCSTSSGDLLVVMDSDDQKQAKVERYSNFFEKQSIQFNANGIPFYSSGGIKYISENSNLDICVSDNGAHAVVVVNQAGKYRFSYKGSYISNRLFLPYGITTDSLSQILTADYNNQCIHLIDQDGQFLRHIDNCSLNRPWGLCVDSKDYLFVADWFTSKVKKIQYIL